MKGMNQFLTTICMAILFTGVLHLAAYTESGNLEAINSASDQYRNIVGIEMSTATLAQKNVSGCLEDGVYVSAVIPTHPADIAGMKAGDIITKIGSFSVATQADALEVINGLEAGRKHSFEICRIDNGHTQKLTLSVLIEEVKEKAIGKIG